MFLPISVSYPCFYNPSGLPGQKRTRGEHQHRVVPESGLLQSQADVAHRLVHGRHHAGVLPAAGVLDETVGGQVALRHLQGLMDRLHRHVEEERLIHGKIRKREMLTGNSYTKSLKITVLMYGSLLVPLWIKKIINKFIKKS